MDYRPVLPSSGPFFRDIHHGQIQHLEQAVISWENSLGLGHFPELPVEALNGVSRIDEPTQFLRELEIGA